MLGLGEHVLHAALTRLVRHYHQGLKLGRVKAAQECVEVPGSLGAAGNGLSTRLHPQVAASSFLLHTQHQVVDPQAGGKSTFSVENLDYLSALWKAMNGTRGLTGHVQMILQTPGAKITVS